MVKFSSRIGHDASRYLLVVAMTSLLVACGGGGGDGDTTSTDDTDIEDFDNDGIVDTLDLDADGDGIDDLDDSFVDLDLDGFDDFSGLTEEEANVSQEPEFVGVSNANPCGSEGGTDNSSANNDWGDNCLVQRSIVDGEGQFADSLYSVGIQRVLFCTGFGTGSSYTAFADGEYGPGSEAALIAFQEDESTLVADGQVGPQTWGRLQDRVELLEQGELGSTPDTYGFTSGACANIPMFYQDTSVAEDGISVQRGGWELARNQPNEAERLPFSIGSPFNRL